MPADVHGRAGPPPGWRALIAVTTCARDEYLRRCLPSLAAATVQYANIKLVVSLDGHDPATEALCEEFAVPLLTSLEREGVGVSKNRVLEQFPDFDYYFFVEDDVEIMDPAIFPMHIALSHAFGWHHMSLFDPRSARGLLGTTRLPALHVAHFAYGSADINFFTRSGLEQVGGWHPIFARFRRWGHTEHSYRFWRAGLIPGPFTIVPRLAALCAWHSPPSVTRQTEVAVDEMGIAEPERRLMAEQLAFVAVQTFSSYRYNGAPLEPMTRLAALRAPQSYPLLTGRARRQAETEYLVWRCRNASSIRDRVLAGLEAGLRSPGNPEWRHEVKATLGLTARGHADQDAA